MLGVVMYGVAPLGLNFKFPNRPWLPGSAINLAVILAWILLFGAPLAAGALAGRRCHVPDDPIKASDARAWQGFAAGLVSGGVAAVFVLVFGTGTVALLVRSASVRDWLYHGQHLTASAVYGRELYASQDVQGYFILLFGFPIIGLLLGLTGAAVTSVAGPLPDTGEPGGPGGPSGPGAPEPVPDPPRGGQLADAGAGELTILRSG